MNIAGKGYVWLMAKALTPPKKIVRDASSGRVVEVRGFGALKGQLKIAKGLDLTKPIYDQVAKKSSRRMIKLRMASEN